MPRPYPPEFRARAVALVRAGKQAKQTAVELGIHPVTLLDQAREDLEEAEQTVADTQQRLGQPFRHAQALADAEEDLARVESQLAAMQDEPAPEPAASESERVELTVETVRAYEPNLGSREGAGREPATPFVPVTTPAAPPGNAPRL